MANIHLAEYGLKAQSTVAQGNTLGFVSQVHCAL